MRNPLIWPPEWASLFPSGSVLHCGDGAEHDDCTIADKSDPTRRLRRALRCGHGLRGGSDHVEHAATLCACTSILASRVAAWIFRGSTPRPMFPDMSSHKLGIHANGVDDGEPEDEGHEGGPPDARGCAPPPRQPARCHELGAFHGDRQAPASLGGSPRFPCGAVAEPGPRETHRMAASPPSQR